MSDDSHNSYGQVVQLILIGIATISSLISLLIPALYHIRKQCREHPTNIISKISLLEALSNYNVILIAVNIYKFQQYVNITNIFDIITFNQPQEPSQTQFCQINYILYMILQLSSIAYNICFSVDLLITLKFPFYAGKKRNKFYDLFAIIFLIVTIPEAISQAEQICENQYHVKSIYKIPMIFILVLAIFYGISLIIIVYSYLVVKKIGSIRAKYVKHHRMILFVLLAAWVFPLWTNILIYQGDQSSDQFYIFNLLSFISLLLLGAIVNIVRFYHDSYVWQRVKKMVKLQAYRKFKTKSQKKQNQLLQKQHSQQMDIWNVPLATAVSQLNNQKIIHSLLQIILEVCSDGQNKSMNNNITIGARSQSIAGFSSKQNEILERLKNPLEGLNKKSQLQQRFIEKNIYNATQQQLKRICKRSKHFNMICLNQNDQIKQKTVFNKTNNKVNVQNEQPKGRSITDLKNHVSLIGDKDIQKRLKTLRSISNFSNSKQKQKFNKNLIQMKNDNIQIKVTSYAHKVFSSIRKMDGIGQFQLSQSLNLNQNFQNILKAKESLGASGSFFFFSHDHKLIIKTITQGQDTVLLNILPKLYIHLKKYKHSLLAKIYGLFSVQIAGISKITFILMQNTFQTMQNQNIQYQIYDLKGSTVKREVKEPKANVLKDINYLKSNDAFIMLSQQAREQLIDQIKADITLLRNQNIMDYSLLLGVGLRKKQKVNMSQFVGQKQHQKQKDHSNKNRKNQQIDFQKDILKRKSSVTYSLQRNRKLSGEIKSIKNNHSLLDKKYKIQDSWKFVQDFQEISGKIYSISVIDYLQQFNLNKYMELKLKKMFKGGGDISSVDSDFYFQRYLNFIKRITVSIKNLKKKSNQKIKNN